MTVCNLLQIPGILVCAAREKELMEELSTQDTQAYAPTLRLHSKAKECQVSFTTPSAAPDLSPALQCICAAPSNTENYQKKKGFYILKAQQEFLKHSDVGCVTQSKKCLIDTDKEA